MEKKNACARTCVGRTQFNWESVDDTLHASRKKNNTIIECGYLVSVLAWCLLVSFFILACAQSFHSTAVKLQLILVFIISIDWFHVTFGHDKCSFRNHCEPMPHLFSRLNQSGNHLVIKHNKLLEKIVVQSVSKSYLKCDWIKSNELICEQMRSKLHNRKTWSKV